MRQRQSTNLKINTNIENSYEGSIRTPYTTKEIKNGRIGLSPQRNNYSTLLNNNEMKEKKIGIIRSNSKVENNRLDYNLIPNSTKAGYIPKALQTKPLPLSTRNNNKDINDTDGSEAVNIMSLIGQNNTPISLKNLSFSIPGYENSKHSVKQMNIIRGYAANTHQGIIRTYNEDRVSIILNIIKPISFQGDYWPKCSFFGIYDGHGGSGCADFLRDNLHQYVVSFNLDN